MYGACYSRYFAFLKSYGVKGLLVTFAICNIRILKHIRRACYSRYFAFC